MTTQLPTSVSHQSSLETNKSSAALFAPKMLVPVKQSSKLPTLHLHSSFVDAKADQILSSFARQGGFSKFMTDCIVSVLTHLYHVAHLTPPSNVRSVSVYVDHMQGVAYTTGSPLDSDHKEIHLSITYFTRQEMLKDPIRLDEELKGVLVHELVHCFQYNASGKAPSGFIEGMADYVRYKAGLSPPHWKVKTRPSLDTEWDAGYQHTAFFFLWLDDKYGAQVTTSLNRGCDHRKFSLHMFKDLTGEPLSDLWTKYKTDESWSPYKQSEQLLQFEQ